MDNSRFHAMCAEWREQEYEGILDFVESNYPKVFQYLSSRNIIGNFPDIPYTHDMVVILHEWQKTHGFVYCRVSRIPKKKEGHLSLIA